MDPVTPAPDRTTGGGRGRSRPIGAVLTVVGDLLIIVAAFLPWVISGEARRDSFAAVRVAQRIGLVGMPVWETLLSVWFLAPLLAALVLVGQAFDRRWLELAAAIPLAVLVGGFSGLLVLAPVQRGAGPLVALVGTALLVIGLVVGRPSRGRAGAQPPSTT